MCVEHCCNKFYETQDIKRCVKPSVPAPTAPPKTLFLTKYFHIPSLNFGRLMMPPSNSPIYLPKDGVPTQYFELSDAELSVRGVTLLSQVPGNVSLSSFSSVCHSSGAPHPLFQQVQSTCHKGGFLGFSKEEPSDRMMNSLGKFSDRNFLSIFRFKPWWSTMWVGTNGSDLQMETQWVFLNVPELSSYVLILPLIEGKFRSALFPGLDGQAMIFAESGSTQVRASSFNAIAYIHMSDNPFNLMKEAYPAVRVHLNTFRLLEEKSVPPIVDKFGWCTWDAFYMTVEPIGVWQGVKEFVEGGVPPRFLIIDEGWQSVSLDEDDPLCDSNNLGMSRLYGFEECEKFSKYKGGTMLSPKAPSFNSEKLKVLIAKKSEVEHAERARFQAARSGATDLSQLNLKIRLLRKELNELSGGNSSDDNGDHETCESCNESKETGLKAFIKDLRTRYKGLDDIYVWQALCGAWGGVKSGATHLDSKIIPAKISPGLDGSMQDIAAVNIVENGVGLIPPDQAIDFYESMHAYLAKIGITGVKVDVTHILEFLCEEYGGRVELAKAYYEGLTKSLVKNFDGTGLISSMQQCNDFFFLGIKQISIGRVGDDFWLHDPSEDDPSSVYWLQGVHMVHCAYNSMWMGQIIQPDWDMFQSAHPCGKFHGGARAICGGPVYVSDSLGNHNFDLLKKLVFPDGTIPKCQHFALPTRDCLFKNPLFDHKTVLKVWNLNKFGGVVGALNCQGAGWDPKEHRIRGFKECYKPMSVSVHAREIEWDQKKEAAEMGGAEEYAVYLNQAEQLLLMNSESDPIQTTIEPSSFEIFSFVPIKKLINSTAKYAPIGLVNMFNSGGTIQELELYEDDDELGSGVKVKVKGGGEFLAYSSEPPKKCYLNLIEVGFEWVAGGKLTLNVPWIEKFCGIAELCFLY